MKTIILAAGEGKRMKSSIPKVMHKILGKPIVDYIRDAAVSAGSEQLIFVVGHEAAKVRQHVGEEVYYALQEEQRGTGHAVMAASDFLRGSGDVLVLYGDMPLISPETIRMLADYHREQDNGVTLVSAIAEGDSDFGRIIRKDGAFLRIVEAKDCSPAQKAVREVNVGMYMFNEMLLAKALTLLENNNLQNEYYLTDTIEIIRNLGYKADAIVAPDLSEFLGVNSRVQLAMATEQMKKRINEWHMERGVSFMDSAATYIGPGVIIGEDTLIYPGTILEGSVKIGKGCVIGPNSHITDSTIGNRTEVANSVVQEAEIGDETSVGPFAYIRPCSVIGNQCKVGDFVEVKNSRIGDNTKASHLTYIGDSEVGSNINFGCGTVTVNFDGTNKYHTVIKDGAFIGCNSNLVAPVTVGEGAYIAAGSTITEDVPANALGIARARQTNKTNWAHK